MCEDASVSDDPKIPGESAEQRVDLTGLSRLSDQPPPPKGEKTIRLVRGLSILFLAIAAAGLPWYLVTRSNKGSPPPGPSQSHSASPSSRPTATPTPANYEASVTGHCLNIRAEPSTTAERLDCVQNGFPLRSDGQTRTSEGRLWRHVYDKLTKKWGWAADQYLKKV